jgi:acetyltransferase-like isoleucine patch superfamily enzyme
MPQQHTLVGNQLRRLLRGALRLTTAIGTRARALLLLATSGDIEFASLSSLSLGQGALLQVSDGGAIRLGKDASLGRGVELTARVGKILVGDRAFIGPWTTITAKSEVSLGDDCLIAERVTIRDQDHEIHGPHGVPIAQAGFQIAPVTIGAGAWIGAGAVILKGVTIGKGAVVAANAVVTRDVADNEIVGGVPARRLGMRKDHDA